MEINRLKIEGLAVLTPRKFEDERGHFFESFNQKQFDKLIGENTIFVQDNESVSKKNVLRGLHFQFPPFSQGKLVRVVEGSVLDVVVDLRKDSSTFGQWHGEILSESNRKLFWIPEGFAHGFVALEENTKFLYKCTNYYSPDSEFTLLWNDATLNIDWGVLNPIISKKDNEGIYFKDFVSPFLTKIF
jgi:dTDP-4-dehydrorhamnose 3,5-epimerase